MSDERRAQVLATLRELIRESDERLGPERIVASASFSGDLNFDSLQMVELVMELEDRFGFEIPDEEAEKIRTVGEAVDYIVAKLGPPQG